MPLPWRDVPAARRSNWPPPEPWRWKAPTPTTLQAPADGQVSVYDLSIDNLIYSGTIRKGQELVFDPVSKTVTVNGLVATSKTAVRRRFAENHV